MRGAGSWSFSSSNRAANPLLSNRLPKPPAEPAPEQPAAEAPPAEPAAEAVPEEQATEDTPPASIETTVEQQLEAQGDDEEARRVRRLRERLSDELEAAEDEDPADEDDDQAGADEDEEDDQAEGERRRDRDGDDQDQADRDRDGDGDIDDEDRADRDRDRDGRDRDRDRDFGWWNRDRDRDRVVERRGTRIIIDLGGGNLVVRPMLPDEGGRLLYRAEDVEVQNLRGGRTRTIVTRDNGVQIITVRNEYGDIVTRVRRSPNGREVVLIDNRFPEDYAGGPVFIDLPPPVVSIPQDQYIVDLGVASPEDIRGALLAPPVQELERAYTLEEVLQNQEVRAYSPRIDLDTITFEFGSSTIGNDQMDALLSLGEAMEEVIRENPAEVYLIEGHTDAVGSDNDNLILSDQPRRGGRHGADAELLHPAGEPRHRGLWRAISEGRHGGGGTAQSPRHRPPPDGAAAGREPAAIATPPQEARSPDLGPGFFFARAQAPCVFAPATATGAPMLLITDLTLRIAGRTLIERANLALPTGAKAGFVGRNGAGKTTLLRAIIGELAPDAGSITLPKGARIGWVEQEAPGGPETLLETVLAADRERASLLAEAEHAVDPHRIADIHSRLADIGAHAAEARAARILAGLGFDHQAQQRPCSEFSGGWRMRVALAAILFAEPEILLLDEPTNYLDLEGTLWLERYLARYPHTLIVISHDRDLLNNAVDCIVHLSERTLTLWRGGYDSFVRQYQEQRVLQGKQRAKQLAERKHMQAFVDRFRAKASKARQAQSRLKAIARLQPIAEITQESAIPFRFSDPKRPLSPPIIRMEGMSVGYEPGKPVLKELDLRIDEDDRIALLGGNGNGKSTFAKLVAGAAAARGRHRHARAEAQHRLLRAAPARNAEPGAIGLWPCAGAAARRFRSAGALPRGADGARHGEDGHARPPTSPAARKRA